MKGTRSVLVRVCAIPPEEGGGFKLQGTAVTAFLQCILSLLLSS